MELAFLLRTPGNHGYESRNKCSDIPSTLESKNMEGIVEGIVKVCVAKQLRVVATALHMCSRLRMLRKRLPAKGLCRHNNMLILVVTSPRR